MAPVFMVLGGSTAHLDAIKTVRRLGLEVLVIDQDPQAIGFQYADHFEVISTLDVERVIEAARKYDIAGSFTISSDLAVPTVCYVNETLGLPNQGIGIADGVSDKGVMRTFFKKHGVSSPDFVVLAGTSLYNRLDSRVEGMLEKGPVIVKPADSSASRGVTKVTDINEIPFAIDKAMRYSRKQKVVIEEFIFGEEAGAQCFSVNGNVELCLVHNDTLYNMVPVGHSFPSKLSEPQIYQIESECKTALKSLGIENGPSNIDIIIDSKGVPYIIEIGARIGGTKLANLIRAHTGVDLIANAISLAVGQPVNLAYSRLKPAAAEMLYFQEDAELSRNPDIGELVQALQPLDYSVDIPEDGQVRTLNSGVDTYGFVLFEGESPLQAEISCRQFLDAVKNEYAVNRTAAKN